MFTDAVISIAVIVDEETICSAGEVANAVVNSGDLLTDFKDRW